MPGGFDRTPSVTGYFMNIYETELNDDLLTKMIQLSEDWKAENSCTGYRVNEKADIEGNRIFLAEDNDEIIGYLFGKTCRAKDMSSVMAEGTLYFEVEELYVIPERRSQGIGQALFNYAEETVNRAVSRNVAGQDCSVGNTSTSTGINVKRTAERRC